MYNIQPIQGPVIVANGHKMHLKCKGLLDAPFVQIVATKVNKTIKGKDSPDLQQKLFSFTFANNWAMLGTLKNGQIDITLSKRGEDSISFYRMLKSGEAILMGEKILSHPPQEQATVALTNTLSKSKFQELTGHTGLEYLPTTAK